MGAIGGEDLKKWEKMQGVALGGEEKILVLNFIDLAGSERASQALSVGQRLKEGCHINHSLLTLGTVIRKLRLIACFLHHLSKTSGFAAA
ncbi:hypothetical protein CQW23_23808 [Capsicum baccatum]|uniref:Kinesin motor domain-containing protein n=1 Tax=Capsicum baccatum TaxID=33114 RepID=A0A2G2VT10_CAPBA|nr:hypothetical protein CQW23_23808 [Capsicum baccatum]